MIRKTFVILMDGDILEIPSSLSLLPFVLKNFFCVDHSTKEFKCVHIWKEPNEKANIFDPTPPQQPTHKVSKGCLVDPSTDLPGSESVDISSRHSVSEVEPLPPFTLLWTHQPIDKLHARVSEQKKNTNRGRL